MHFNSMSEGDIAFFIAALLLFLYVGYAGCRFLNDNNISGVEKLPKSDCLIHLLLQGVGIFFFGLSTMLYSTLVVLVIAFGWVGLVYSTVWLVRVLERSPVLDPMPWGQVSLPLLSFGSCLGIMMLAFD